MRHLLMHHILCETAFEILGRSHLQQLYKQILRVSSQMNWSF
jgi:hypothetical protein